MVPAVRFVLCCVFFAAAAHAQEAIFPSTLPDGTVGLVYGTGATLSVNIGSGVDDWSVSAGSLPPGLSLLPVQSSVNLIFGIPTAAGTYTFTIKVVDTQQSGLVLTQTYTIKIAAAGFTFSVSPQSLAFKGVAGGDAAAPQVLNIGVTVPFGLSIDDGKGGPAPTWLSATPNAGIAPALVTVTATPGTLAAGVYSARIHIIPGGGTATPIDVAVTFTLTAGTPSLEVTPKFLRFQARASAPGTQDQEIVVRNSGGGAPIPFQASVSGGSPWLSISGPAQTTPNAPAIVKVHVSTVGLTAANYTDTIHIASQAGISDTTVSLFVAADGPILLLTESGLHFAITQGAGNAHAEIVNVLNVGDPAATINWSATVAATPNWISVTPASGNATTGMPGSISVTTNAAAAQLAPGAYYALITVSAPNTQDSPESFSAVLEVQPATGVPQPDVSPGGLLFVAATGGNTPPAQKITVYNSSLTAVNFQASASTRDGAKWLAVSPAAGTSSTALPGVLSVSVNPTGLKTGVYTGEIDVNESGVVRSAAITLLVAGPASTAAPEGRAIFSESRPAMLEGRSAAAGCNGFRTVITPVGIPGNFSLPAAWPETLGVLLTDDCGTPLPAGIGSVIARFDNGDAPITLHDFQGTGSYSADWSPLFPAGNVTITFAASAGQLQPTTAQIGGGVNKNALAPPVLSENGTVNNANPLAGASVAPGTVSAIYGQNLATATVSPGLLPLPTLFSGTSVTIGGIAAPLYFLSNGQLDVQIPAELQPNQHYQVAVVVNAAYAVLPGGITLVPSAPGVSTFPDGVHLIAQHSDFSLVDDTRPAHPGESLVTYLSGMGPTIPPVATGAQAPLDPLAKVVTQPTMTIDGQPAVVLFAGLTPQGIGLYQINFTVPLTARAGDLDVVIKQGTVLANLTKLKVIAP